MRPDARSETRRISAEELAALSAGGTNAHRVWTERDGWADRFGPDFVVSHVSEAGGRALCDELESWCAGRGLECGRIFLRLLVKQPRETDAPMLARGSADRPLEGEVLERGLKFGVDFGGGYSAGLFCDQRENRAHLESLKPSRVLNGFAYTCAFSVAAARAGAETLSVDLSRKSLEAGRRNFARNGFPETGHRWIADDVFSVLPRLGRRGERFDAIILDPPTFSRGAKGRVFRAERNLGDLLELALPLRKRDGVVLLSTNASAVDPFALRRLARLAGLPAREVPPPAEYPPGSAAAAIWLG